MCAFPNHTHPKPENKVTTDLSLVPHSAPGMAIDVLMYVTPPSSSSPSCHACIRPSIAAGHSCHASIAMGANSL